MQECGACGLLFGGSETCPSCGSRFSEPAPEEVDDTSSSRYSGPLPGEDALDDALDGIDGMDMELPGGVQDVQSGTLPFQLGARGKFTSNLPFGVGAPASIPVDSSSPIEVTENSTNGAPPIVEDVIENDPVQVEAASENVEDIPTIMEAKPIILETTDIPDQIHDDSEMVVLKARPIIQDDEQLSDSPELVENAYQINASNFDTEHVYSVEQDVVFHDFGDELQVSEVVVNFDELVDPADQTVQFDPVVIGDGEPELLPARALPIDDSGDVQIASTSIAAFEALTEGNWESAADLFREICTALPGDPAALNDFGLSLLQLAIEIHADHPTATPAEEPHFEAAVLALRQAAQQDKRNPTILYNLATCLATCGRHGVAERIWDAAISLSPEDAAALNGKAVSLIALDEFDSAAALLMRARDISPTESVILRNLRRLRPTV
ncbi:MAG: hypothetical protein VX906_00470 [Candidatus Thermoplasmatota archaeon]|nr:hypothetical protein [Candidatus Thermoplasmatota archaeon]